jgi:hypothetical protein
LGLAFFAVGTATALVGAGILALRWVRYGAGAVRPRTSIERDEAVSCPQGGETAEREVTDGSRPDSGGLPRPTTEQTERAQP